MNEQQLADLLSQQLDRLLLGQEVVVPAEAAELYDVLSLGRQLSQVQFQASAAAGAVFESQLATWSGVEGMPAGIWGIPKALFIGLVGAGVGLALLTLGALTVLNTEPTPQPTQAIIAPDTATPAPPAPPATATNQPVTPKNKPAPPKSSQGETLNPAKSSSQSDQLPGLAPIVLETPAGSPPTTAITTTAPITAPTTVDDGAGGSDNSDSISPASDQDRGHGNDPGGVDPDNPGNSSGVNGGLGRDGSSSGDNGSSGDNSGNNASQDNNKSKDKKNK